MVKTQWPVVVSTRTLPSPSEMTYTVTYVGLYHVWPLDGCLSDRFGRRCRSKPARYANVLKNVNEMDTLAPIFYVVHLSVHVDYILCNLRLKQCSSWPWGTLVQICYFPTNIVGRHHYPFLHDFTLTGCKVDNFRVLLTGPHQRNLYWICQNRFFSLSTSLCSAACQLFICFLSLIMIWTPCWSRGTCTRGCSRVKNKSIMSLSMWKDTHCADCCSPQR